MFPSQPFTLQTKQNKDKLLFPFLFFLYPLRKGRGQASLGFNLNTLTKINFLLCFIYIFIYLFSFSLFPSFFPFSLSSLSYNQSVTFYQQSRNCHFPHSCVQLLLARIRKDKKTKKTMKSQKVSVQMIVVIHTWFVVDMQINIDCQDANIVVVLVTQHHYVEWNFASTPRTFLHHK